jgi:UDPglucose 6-dehydrogenase
LGLCYNPEFIALGSVVHDMLFPDVVLIGESDTEAGDRLAAISARLCENKPAVCRMSMINAEITKLAINTFVTTKISYANMLGEICERLPGADAVTVAAAIGMDSRIGSKYLRPSVGYGGPCFPRDNLAFVTLAAKLGARADLSAATDGLNRYQVERLLQRLSGLATPPASIGILGLSYKPHTPVVEESFGVALAAACVARGYKVAVADPMALRGALDILGDGVRACDSGDECVAVSDVVFITTAWPDYSTLDLDAIAQRGRPLTIIDCWRLLDPKQLADNVEVVQIGRG